MTDWTEWESLLYQGASLDEVLAMVRGREQARRQAETEPTALPPTMPPPREAA